MSSYLKQNKISVDHKNFYIDVMDSTKHPGTFRYEIHARSGAEVAFGFKQPTVEAAINQAKKRIDDGRIAL